LNLAGYPINDYSRGITELETLQVEYVKKEERMNVNLKKQYRKRKNYAVTRYRIS
jgi:hypothetical protein